MYIIYVYIYIYIYPTMTDYKGYPLVIKHSYGKASVSIGRSTLKGSFSIAMFLITRGIPGA